MFTRLSTHHPTVTSCELCAVRTESAWCEWMRKRGRGGSDWNVSRLFFLAHSLAHVYKRISIPNQLRNPARLNETLVCIAEAFRGWFGGVWGLPRGEGSVFVSTSGVRAGCADPRNRRVLTKTETSPLQPLQTSLLARRNTIAMFTNTHVKVWYFCNFSEWYFYRNVSQVPARKTRSGMQKSARIDSGTPESSANTRGMFLRVTETWLHSGTSREGEREAR